MQIIFLYGTKCLSPNKFLVQHKKFGLALNILRPVKGQGRSAQEAKLESASSKITVIAKQLPMYFLHVVCTQIKLEHIRADYLKLITIQLFM